MENRSFREKQPRIVVSGWVLHLVAFVLAVSIVAVCRAESNGPAGQSSVEVLRFVDSGGQGQRWCLGGHDYWITWRGGAGVCSLEGMPEDFHVWTFREWASGLVRGNVDWAGASKRDRAFAWSLVLRSWVRSVLKAGGLW